MQCMKIHIAADDIIMIILSLFLETQNTMLSHQIIMHPDPSVGNMYCQFLAQKSCFFKNLGAIFGEFSKLGAKLHWWGHANMLLMVVRKFPNILRKIVASWRHFPTLLPAC